jgi:predicted MFS family arabinose efflux permease
VQLLAALSAGATSALLVILAERHLGTGPGGFGLLLAAIGAGAALGPLLLTRLTANPRRPALVFGPYLLRGLVDLILATTRNLPTAMAALALYGVGTSTGMVTYNSLLQAEVPAHNRGRVFAEFDMIWQTGRLASLGLGGAAADALGIQAVYLLGGLVLLLAGSIGWPGCGPSKAPAPVRDLKDPGTLISHSPARVPVAVQTSSSTSGMRRSAVLIRRMPRPS